MKNNSIKINKSYKIIGSKMLLIISQIIIINLMHGNKLKIIIAILIIKMIVSQLGNRLLIIIDR